VQFFILLHTLNYCFFFYGGWKHSNLKPLNLKMWWLEIKIWWLKKMWWLKKKWWLEKMTSNLFEVNYCFHYVHLKKKYAFCYCFFLILKTGGAPPTTFIFDYNISKNAPKYSRWTTNGLYTRFYEFFESFWLISFFSSIFFFLKVNFRFYRQTLI